MGVFSECLMKNWWIWSSLGKIIDSWNDTNKFYLHKILSTLLPLLVSFQVSNKLSCSTVARRHATRIGSVGRWKKREWRQRFLSLRYFLWKRSSVRKLGAVHSNHLCWCLWQWPVVKRKKTNVRSHEQRTPPNLFDSRSFFEKARAHFIFSSEKAINLLVHWHNGQ